jgi:hypothetical protein
MKPEGLLQSSQDPSTRLYPDQHQSRHIADSFSQNLPNCVLIPPGNIFPGFPTKNLYVFEVSVIPFPSHCLDLITLIFSKDYKLCCIFHFVLSPLRPKHSPQNTTLSIYAISSDRHISHPQQTERIYIVSVF